MIGSFVARELVNRGFEVHGVLRFRTHWGNLRGLIDVVKWHKGDITDSFFVSRLIEELRPEAVYHFAAQSLNGISLSAPKLSFDVNVIGFLNVLEALRASNLTGTRVLHAGSSTVYGKTAETWEGPIPEHAPLLPATQYGVSKAAAEMLGRQYWYAHGIPVITGRFFQQVAPGGPETLAIQDFSKQVAMIEAGLQPPVLIHGNLETLRDMTDVRDSARVMVDLLRVGEPGDVYNVCSNRALPVRTILDLLLAKSTHKSITTQVDPSRLRTFDEKILLGDNSKLVGITGWKPSTQFEDTVQDVLDYWRTEVGVRYGTTKSCPGPSDEA